MEGPARIAFLLAGLSFAGALPAISGVSPETGPAEPRYEVWFELAAEYRGSGARADIQAGGRLLMEPVADASGQARLELVRPLEDPWKLYWVDPLGPFGQEIKLATVTTLPESTWEALEAAQADVARIGRDRHALWLEDARRKRPLDGAFGFVVVGPARGRFAIDFHPDGSVREISNRMTDRWLPGPFDQFVGNRTPVSGYWFWNQGETRPPAWEPHTYHALAKALELLALPLPPPTESESDSPELSWEDPATLAFEVLSSLAPKIASRSRDRPSRPDTIQVEYRRQRRILRVALDQPESGLQVDRETLFTESPDPPESDRLRIRIENRRRLLEIEVGYRATTPRSSARPAG